MSKKKLILSIPNPCKEDWNSFSQTQKGKYCANCSKIIVDFTKSTDSEIAKVFSNSNAKICGRFLRTQLQKEIAIPTTEKNYSFLARLFAGVLFLSNPEDILGNNSEHSSATTENYTNSGKRNEVIGKTLIAPNNDTSKYAITGKITDNTLQPVAFASILIKNTNFGCVADKNGFFKITIPKTIQKQKITLLVTATGYESNETVLGRIKFDTHKNIQIQISEALLGEIVIVSQKNRG